MAKVEQKEKQPVADITGKYARVMHHIGGLTGKNDNSDMIRGGEDELVLVTQEDLPEGTNVERLVSLGALRSATPDEVKRWEVSKGLREDSDDESFVFNTTGQGTLKGTAGANSETEGTGGEDAPDKALQQAKTPEELAAAGGIIMSGDRTGSTGDDTGNADTTGDDTSGAATTYKGMGKGALSEYTVPELKDFAKQEGIEGYNEMLKPALLDALLALNTK